MLTVFNFDLTNPVHANVFAQVCAITSQAQVPMQVGVGASAPVSGTDAQAQASAPVSAPAKVYAPAQDVECLWVQDKNHVSYTLADGKYVGQAGARKTLNKRLRDAGAEWDPGKKVWTFKSTKAATEFVANTSALVTAQDIEDVRAKAAARAAKKAGKTA